MSSELSLKGKLVLVGFGLLIGLVASEFVLRQIKHSRAGSEFESIEALEASILQEDDRDHSNPDSVSLRSIINPNPDRKIIYDLRPNLDVTFQRVNVRTNSCAMRDVEREVSKPAYTYRIAALGDSFTFGWGVEQSASFVAQLEANLNELAVDSQSRPTAPITKVEVLNFGVPGYSTFQEVELFKTRAVEFAPDAVLLFWVENDFGLPFFVADQSSSGGLLSNITFVEMARRVANPGEQVEQLVLKGLDPNSALRDLSATTRELGIPVYLAPNPKQQWLKDRRKLWYLRKDRSITVIDWVDQFRTLVERRNITPEQLSLSFDPHPSPLKHELMADLLTPYFSAAIWPIDISR